MSQVAYLIIAIVILVSLLAVFVISFVLYKRTPAPKGCEDILMGDEKCSTCQQTNCSFNKGKGEE